jgi:acid phosphatase
MERTLIVITWDEGAGKDFKSNKVLTLLFGDVVNPGQYRNEVNHYSLLRTIEDNFGLEPVASGDREADPLPDAVWRNH